MIFAVFILFAANLILRFNEYVPSMQEWPIVQIMIPILLVLWLFFVKKDFTFATDYLVPCFFVVVCIGYAVMIWAAGLSDVLRYLVPWVAVYFLAASIVNTPRKLDLFFGLMIVCGLAMVVHSAQQMWSYDGFSDESGVGFSGITVFQGRARYAGVMNDPNDLALYFAMMLPLALQLSVKGMKFGLTIIGLILAAVLLYGIFLTNSRGGMLAAGVVLTFYAHRRFGGMKGAVLCGLFIMAAITFGPSRVREQSESEESSTQGRIEAWHEGLEVLKQYPLLGCGIGDFTPTYNPITAHNSFVLGFAETGFIGYVAWFGSGYYVLYAMHQMLKRTRPGTKSYRQASALFESLIAFYVAGFFLSRTYFILLPMFLGLAVGRFKLFKTELDNYLESSPEVQSDATDLSEREDQGDMQPDAEPLPDFSPKAILPSMPRLASYALFSIVGIWLIVRFKL